jgi:flagellar basal body-associated protein FliL
MEDFEKNNNPIEEEKTAAEESAQTATNEAEEAVENTAEIVDETVEAADDDAEVTDEETGTSDETVQEAQTDDFGLSPEALSEINGTTAVKTKKKIQAPIIIAAVILLAALIAGGVYFFFFNNSVVGTWVEAESASADEAKGGDGKSLRYYTFEQDGTAKISLGSMQVVGTWSYAKDDSSTTDQPGNTINVAISYFFTGTFKIDVQGNGLTGRTLTLDGYGSKVKFNSATKPEPELKVDSKFDPKNDVVGKWKNDEQNVTYTFNADGTCNLNQMDMLIIDGVYSVNKKTGKIDIKYIEEKENTLNIEYKAKDKKTMTFSGFDYKKVEE